MGKTTHIKFLIRELVKKVEDTRTLLYLSCDPLMNRNELWATLTEYIKWIRSFSKEKLYIFLDEVTIIKNWQVAIKDMYDHGMLKNVTIVATGSHSLDVKRGGEQLPGRRGRYVPPADRELLPMNFPQFIEAFDPRFYSEIKRILDSAPTLEEKILSLKIYREELERYFQHYLLTGGFPKPVSEYKRSRGREISVHTYNDIIYYLRGDIIKSGKKPETGERILNTIIEKIGTPISYNTIANEVGIDTKTAKKYIETLESMYLLNTIHHPNPKTWQKDEKKRKKIYPTDPFILYVAKHMTNNYDNPFEASKQTLKEKKPAILELVIANHLKRINPQTYYWKTKKGKEIDFITITEKKLTAIEVKQNIDKTKTHTTQKRTKAIPIKKKKQTIITGEGKEIEINKEKNTAKIPIETLLFALEETIRIQKLNNSFNISG